MAVVVTAVLRAFVASTLFLIAIDPNASYNPVVELRKERERQYAEWLKDKEVQPTQFCSECRAKLKKGTYR